MIRIKDEEAVLREEFKGQFNNYKAKVPLLVPFTKRFEERTGSTLTALYKAVIRSNR